MALVHEDGTAKPDAESFASVAFVDDYWDKRGNLEWVELGPQDKEAALRKASDFIETHYGLRFRGERKTELQALSWPRTGAFYGDRAVADAVVPIQLQRACAELALRATQGDLTPDQGRTVKSEKVGEIEVSYDVNGPTGTRFTAVEQLISPLLDDYAVVIGPAIKLVRV